MHPRLLEVADRYLANKKSIHEIEGKTGISSIHVRTMKDMRNALDHVSTGISKENAGDERKASYHYGQAFEHLREHLLNVHQIIAGRILTQSEEKLQDASFFDRTGEAQSFHDDAVQLYNQGRDIRTDDRTGALEHFSNAIELALRAKRQITGASKREKWAFKISVVAMLLLLANVVYAILS